MDRLKPLMLPKALEQQRSLFADFQRRDHEAEEGRNALFEETANRFPSSESSNPTLCSTPFRLPISSALPCLTNVAASPRSSKAIRPNSFFADDDFSDLSNLRSKRWSEATFTSNYDLSFKPGEFIASTPKSVPADTKRIDRRAMQFNNSAGIRSVVKATDLVSRRSPQASPLLEKSQDTSGSPPLKINYGQLFTALCITDPTALSHPMKLTTSSYKLSHLGLLQLGTSGVMSGAQPGEQETWDISQELGLDGRPKFLLEWRGTLTSFIPGRGKMYLASQIDITSVLRGMAAYDLNNTHQAEFADGTSRHSLPEPDPNSTAMAAFVEMFTDVKMQFKRYFVVQQKPRSRIPLPSPGTTAGFRLPASPRGRGPASPRSPHLPRPPSSPRPYAKLTDYAIIFASPEIHARGEDATFNFMHCPRSVLDALERHLGGTRSFELPVKWGLSRQLLWLVGVQVSDGTARWWVCFLLDWDDEIF
ncbi:hypothetical protein EJ05DRAFT_362341 [Pseudovirgaria hyperparasitica]|uniref:Uncharacterized protein n=1 Tax=Pseudovirgaria hyperparasitica TaxID=470096 RepID=A0A6A6W957_9PEZI|nr:uncharacterized protein EJ05DRAFT_362341 [Pseudovirgaria hyperparasitica]KAF2758729.1 hypothetical protein EJ05DRAFT_362341 [Pseudovirgaria hyperparasitica]